MECIFLLYGAGGALQKFPDKKKKGVICLDVPDCYSGNSEVKFCAKLCGVTVPVTYNPDMDMLTGSVSTAELGAEFDLTISGM